MVKPGVRDTTHLAPHMLRTGDASGHDGFL